MWINEVRKVAQEDGRRPEQVRAADPQPFSQVVGHGMNTKPSLLLCFLWGG